MTDRTTAIDVDIDANPPTSAVSWGAVLAGALVATAVTLALMVLGAGLGLTLVSPWWEGNADATTIAVSTIVWLVVMQWASAGIGGYLTGRLRTRWTRVHSDEVFFRDTAHGFLAWAVATLIVAGFAGVGLMSAVSTATQTIGATAGAAIEGVSEGAADSLADPTAYFVDTLYRPASPAGEEDAAAAAPAASAPAAPPAAAAPEAPDATAQSSEPAPPAAPGRSASSPDSATPSSDPSMVRDETTRIVLRGMTAEAFPEEDRAYLAQRVAAETGMSRQEAEARVDSVLQGLSDAKSEAQAAAEEAREGAIALAVVAFISLLVGAFIGMVASALGGRQRDASDGILVP
jgi:hypothetical protein